MGYNDAGSAGNVQAGDPGSEADAEGLAGAYQQIVGRNKKAQGPNANAYNKQVGDAQGNADAYSDQARNFTQSAPTIANAYQDQSRSDIGLNTGSERYLGDHLRDIMEGKDVTGAQAQIQQGTDAGIAAQMNVAHSAKGGGAAQAGAVRSAQQQGALQQAGVAAQAGQLQAQLASAAAGQQANVYGNIGSQLGQQYGLEQGSAIHQADLQSTNQGQIDQTRLGYGALGNGAQGGSLAALNGYTNGNLSAQGLQPGIDAENGGGKLVGTAASVAGAALMSDERVKTGISSEGTGGSRVDAFLDGIHPLSYHYKQASNEPRSQATGGRYLGISAQDLEAVPEVGHQMVSDGPRGKQVEIGPSLSAALAGVARLNERLKAVEGGGTAMHRSAPTHRNSSEDSLGPSGEDNRSEPDYNYIHSPSPLNVSYALEQKNGSISPQTEAYMRREGMWGQNTDSLLRERHRDRPDVITSDMAAKTDVVTEGHDPRAAVWDQAHDATLANVGMVGRMTPEELRASARPEAEQVRGIKAGAYDEGFDNGHSAGMAALLKSQHAAGGRAMDAANAEHAANRKPAESFDDSLSRYNPVEGVRAFLRDASAPSAPRPVQQRGAPIAHEAPPSGSFSEQLRDRFGAPRRNDGEPTLASLYSPQSGGQR